MFNNQLFSEQDFQNCKSRGELPFKCTLCQKEFTKKKNEIQDRISKQKTDGVQYFQFCSKDCHKIFLNKQSEDNLETITCTHCKKEFLRNKSQNKLENNFCSRSCSVSYNNSKNPKRSRAKKCKICNNMVKSGYTYCESCISNGEHKKRPSDNSIKINKKCPTCKETKEVSKFYKQKDDQGISSYCKKCAAIQAEKRAIEFKKECSKYKGGKCEKCGYNDYIGSLEFHHKDPLIKSFSINNSKTWIVTDEVKEELDKCILLCGNCHREEHRDIIQTKRRLNNSL